MKNSRIIRGTMLIGFGGAALTLSGCTIDLVKLLSAFGPSTAASSTARTTGTSEPRTPTSPRVAPSTRPPPVPTVRRTPSPIDPATISAEQGPRPARTPVAPETTAVKPKPADAAAPWNGAPESGVFYP